MRILSIDPGAERCGYGVIDDSPLKHILSGIRGVSRNNSAFQEYKVKLIEYWSNEGQNLINACQPDVLITEIVPIKGGSFGAMAQMYLANTVVTVLQSMAFCANIPVEQIAANSVKLKIGGKKDASKVKVRNGVYALLPETKRLKERNWSKVFDESDALAVGLAYLGYDIRKIDGSSKKEGITARTNTPT